MKKEVGWFCLVLIVVGCLCYAAYGASYTGVCPANGCTRSVVAQPVRPWSLASVPMEVTVKPAEPVKVEVGTEVSSRPTLRGRTVKVSEDKTLSVGPAQYKQRRGLLGVPRWRRSP
jgi:hypothetical protein